jgi:hypothetical protein
VPRSPLRNDPKELSRHADVPLKKQQLDLSEDVTSTDKLNERNLAVRHVITANTVTISVHAGDHYTGCGPPDRPHVSLRQSAHLLHNP